MAGTRCEEVRRKWEWGGEISAEEGEGSTGCHREGRYLELPAPARCHMHLRPLCAAFHDVDHHNSELQKTSPFDRQLHYTGQANDTKI